MNSFSETPALLVRVSKSDAHYGGDLVAGAFVLKLFGDAVTFLSMKEDGDEGLLASYSDVIFHKPVYPGDFLAVYCTEAKRTKLTRTYQLSASLQGRSSLDNAPTSGDAWNERGESVATAVARVVIPVEVAKGGRRKYDAI